MWLRSRELTTQTVISHQTQLGREDLKIESQNKKVRAVHNALITRQKKVQELSVLDSLSTTGSTNALMKATTALEKSTAAFERVVDEAISLAGTGSGKVPLLLPSTVIVQIVQIDTQSTHHE